MPGRIQLAALVIFLSLVVAGCSLSESNQMGASASGETASGETADDEINHLDLLTQRNTSLGGSAFDRRISTGVGDINDDGHDDLAYVDKELFIRFISGKDYSNFAIGDLTSVSNDRSNMNIAAVGDFNKDGYNDLIVGLPSAGKVAAISGKDRSILFSVNSPSVEEFGKNVTGVGDFDGDSFPDFAVYGVTTVNVEVAFDTLAPSRTGKVFVYSGATRTLLFQMSGPADSGFGLSLSTEKGDLNQDGCDDLVVGAPFNGRQRSTSSGEWINWGTGRVYGISGCSMSMLFFLDGAVVDGKFGYQVDIIKDINNDGKDDIVVSTTGHRDSTSNQVVGKISIYSGADRGLLVSRGGSPITEQSSNNYTSNGGFAGSMINVGDFDGDGFDDLLADAHANCTLSTPVCGTAVVLSGKSLDTIFQKNFVVQISGTASHIGGLFSVSRAGDLNNDGYADIISHITDPAQIGQYYFTVTSGGP